VLLKRKPASFHDDSEDVALSAEIIWLCNRRANADADLQIDLHTAVDVAIRDLQEIETYWGTEPARERLAECRAMLQTVLATL
jgi:hypothetical protein